MRHAMQERVQACFCPIAAQPCHPQGRSLTGNKVPPSDREMPSQYAKLIAQTRGMYE